LFLFIDGQVGGCTVSMPDDVADIGVEFWGRD
jgi:hypothetical protein